jgi:protein-L-isoaspartate(D-aspartate) O-methyltransferase
MTDFARLRANMVASQLRPNRVDEPRVLAAMAEVPRELFCPPPLRGVAYGDDDIELGDGRFLLEPLTQARLIQVAAPQPSDVALVLGCHTGCTAAVLARLVSTVFLLVPTEAAVEPIEQVLGEIESENVLVQVGPAAAGLPAQAPFDVILLAGSVEQVPATLLEQLGPGGRLVAVVGSGRLGKLTLCRRIGNAIGRTTPFDAAIPALTELRKPPEFAL